MQESTLKKLKERWDTPVGKKFREKIIRQLKNEKSNHSVDWNNLKIVLNNGAEVLWVDFPGVSEIEIQVDLRGVDLKGEDLSGAKLERANFWCANMGGVSLRGANLEKAYFWLADLEGTDLSGANLKGAKLSDANLEGADLGRVNLEGAILSGSNLKGAVLMGANLEGAKLWDANLEGTDLRGVKLEKANLTHSQFRLKSFFWRIGLSRVVSWIWGGLGKDNTKWQATLFDGAEIKNVKLDSNPLLHRNLLDEQWLDRFTESWWRKPLYWFWLWTSNCGRSVSLLLIWAFIVALFFCLVYANISVPAWIPGPIAEFCVNIDPHFEYKAEIPLFWRPWYLSIVTMTTLGVSEVSPVNAAGVVWHSIQNIIGYLLLGYTIAVLGSKLTRRSA